VRSQDFDDCLAVDFCDTPLVRDLTARALYAVTTTVLRSGPVFTDTLESRYPPRLSHAENVGLNHQGGARLAQSKLCESALQRWQLHRFDQMVIESCGAGTLTIF
jgi:hypothetical protein